MTVFMSELLRKFKGMTILKRRILAGIGIVACLGAVIGAVIYYSIFTSAHIFDESANHLDEIYNQVNTSFTATIERNWNILYGWTEYIEEKADEAVTDETAAADLKKFMDDRKSDWGFTSFYFIDKDGTGILLDGRTRGLGFDPSQIERLTKGYNIVHDGTREEDNEPITIFAIPTSDKKYIVDGKTFEYIAMGVTFNNDDMTNTVNIEAFEGEGHCYITNGSGDVLIASEESHFNNFINHLEDEGVIGDKEKAEIVAGLLDGKSSTTLFNIHGEEYYLTYQPIMVSVVQDGVKTSIQVNDWMMLGIVPSDILNSSMSTFRLVTVFVMGGVFILLAIAVVVIVIVVNKRHVKEKEIQLQSRDNLFDMLTTNTKDIYVLFSPDTFASEYVSPNVTRILGVDPAAVKADVRNILDAAVNRPGSFTTEGLKKLPQEGTWDSELQLKSLETGDHYWFKLMLYRSVLSGKDSFVMMLSDRTEEQLMNDKLHQMLDIAKAANSAKSNFLSNMSHDIRTPMNAIIGFSTLLARNAEKPDVVREYVKKITYSGQHLLGLINDVLDMSKIESGKTSLNIEEFSFPDFLEVLYSMVLPQTKAKRQHFDMHTKGNIPDLVLGDRLRLNQILLNLLSNAVKYTPENGNIELTIEEMAQKVHNHIHLCFTVKDNGLGMSEDFVKTIFDPFTREVTTDTKSIQGTGLGMAITKNIVDLMGGTISVQSKLGEGSSFLVELELAVAEKMDDDEFWKRHNITRALIVDDEEDICLNIKELMSDTGVEITYALSGKTAVEYVETAIKQENDYHIILLDWKMPEMDGLETAQRIRAIVGENVPIMVLTSYNFDEIEEQAKNAGIDFFLPKPFFMSSFRRAIEQVRGTKKANEEIAATEEISLKGLKVLAAEDNEINAEILTELLADEGVECEVAHNGREAVEKFTSCKPGSYDLILMDIQMPVMNGYDAARAIRASEHSEAKTIPILAMTANAFDDDVKMALNSGMNAHMAKPIDVDKMRTMIAEFRKKK